MSCETVVGIGWTWLASIEVQKAEEAAAVDDVQVRRRRRTTQARKREAPTSKSERPATHERAARPNPNAGQAIRSVTQQLHFNFLRCICYSFRRGSWRKRTLCLIMNMNQLMTLHGWVEFDVWPINISTGAHGRRQEFLKGGATTDFMTYMCTFLLG